MPDLPERISTPLRFTLLDGTPVRLRPIAARDRERIRAGLERLSPESRLSRFFAPLPYLSDTQLRYLTEIDQERHVAWGAVVESEAATEDEMLGLAVGRFARLEATPEVAEVAIAVVDDYQRRGLGRLLFALLYVSAHRHGIRTLRAVILLQNQHLIAALRALGGRVEYQSGIAQVDLPVVEDLAHLPDSPEASEVRDLLHHVMQVLDEAEHPSA